MLRELLLWVGQSCVPGGDPQANRLPMTRTHALISKGELSGFKAKSLNIPIREGPWS